MLNSILRFVVVGVLVIAVAIGLLIAWWIALLAVLGLAAFFAVRRLLGLSRPVMRRRPPGFGDPRDMEQPAKGAAVIEGEYVVDGEDQSTPKRVKKDHDPA